jgi:TolB-like protein/Tfp pilus assembly protein PilF
MGEVYRARDPRLDREVAIKVLPEQIPDPKRLRRFEQEARAAGALNHPNVLAVYDVGTHGGVPYVVSELLEGQTLHMRLAGGALPVRRALDYALQIAHGLAAAHDKGIVHRDLKPENVFITEDGRVKILDFGLAKLIRSQQLIEEEEKRLGTGSTSSGAEGMGTVGYMSPEQVRGEPVDHRSDIFAFGAVLFEMLSGTRAFRRECAAETMNAILKEDPPELRASTPGISPGLERLVHRCLEKRASDRFRSAHDLALALETVSSERPGEEHGASHAALVVTRYKKLSLAAVAGIVLAGGFYGFYRTLAPARATPVTDVIDSLAVLPFENVGGDPESDYLSDGVAESLITELSRRSDLKVMARSTSFRFRGKDVDPRQVGRDLAVGAVLTGRVSVRGDTLLIGAELVDVARGTRLWGEQYKTPLRDIVALEQDIAGEISRGLRLKPQPRDETLRRELPFLPLPLGIPTRRPTEDSEAYRLTLLSRYEINNAGTPERTKKALEYAQQAVERDPTYAPAYEALARAYLQMGGREFLPNREAMSRARTAAMKALEIDESLPEAHMALGWVRARFDWDWAGADRSYRRAIELNPNSPDAHFGYSLYLGPMGRFQEGIAHAKRAVELDPLTPQRRRRIGQLYFFSREYDQALGAFREALEFDPNLGGFHFYLGWIYREKGMYEEAVAEFRKELGDGPRGPLVVGHLGNAYARAGREREARECLRELKQRSKVDTVGTYEVAFIHAGLGEKDEAFDWLEKAYAERDQGMLYLKVDPALDPLRSDRRFEDFLRRMNFPS